jgi:hypothetical protein
VSQRFFGLALLVLTGSATCSTGAEAPRHAGARTSQASSGMTPLGEFPGCELFAPASRESLPPPVSWRPCSITAGSCRQIAMDWAAPPGHEAISAGASARRDGSVVLGLTRTTVDGLIALVADADGPVHAAVLSRRPELCVAAPTGLGPVSPSRYAFEVSERGRTLGVVGGAHSMPRPTLGLRFEGEGHGFVVGDSALLHVARARFELLSWKDGKHIASPRTENAPSFPHFVGDALVWNESEGGRTRVRAHGAALDLVTASEGERADAGGDGRDWVWSQREPNGRASLYTLFNHAVRRLHPSSPIAGLPSVVGGGWVARLEVEAGRLRGVRGVRIRDRASVWLESTPEFRFEKPLAIARDELFVLIADRGSASVARVRLDQLIR